MTKHAYGTVWVPLTVALTLMLVCALVPSASAARQDFRAARAYKGFSDEAVEEAIGKGVRWLWEHQNDDGSFSEVAPRRNRGGIRLTGHYAVGRTAIAMYALLESGASVQDERVKKTLKYLEETWTDRTYDIALRANVWLLAMRGDDSYRKHLQKDVDILVKSDLSGSYTYQSRYALKDAPRKVKERYQRMIEARRKLRKQNPNRRRRFRRGDNSNAQYGVLGVWAGVRGNVEVPSKYWKAVEEHWSDCQSKDGGWGYSSYGRQKPYPAMTAAGVATLFVCADNLYYNKFLRCDTGLEMTRINNGLKWIEKHFDESMKPPKKGRGGVMVGNVHGLNNYYLYGIERVGLASGYKYFGKSDWYKAGASYLLRMQNKKGFWPGGWADGQNLGATAYAVLFLLRGRQPVLMNKLEYDCDWNNRPRAVANACHWMTRKFETEINWQIINLKVPVSEWHDAPVLLLTGSREPKFSDKQLDKLRQFVHEGGTLYSITECNGEGFSEGIRKVYRKLFPDYELTPCPDDHPIQNTQFDLRGRIRFHEIHNGVRPLVVHSDQDLPFDWQQYRHRTKTHIFEAAANVPFYICGKDGFRPRGTSPWPKEQKFRPVATVKIARLKHNAHYDPEPLAWARMARLMGNRLQVKLDVSEPMAMGQLGESEAKVAVLSGTGRLKLTLAQKTALQKFLLGGGTLIVEACGGNEAFADSAEKAIAGMMRVPSLMDLPATHPLYRREKMEIDQVRYRRGKGKAIRKDNPDLKVAYAGRRAAVIFSDKDMTAGLLGITHDNIDGYMPEDAVRLMRNIVLYAAGSELDSPDEKAPAAEGKIFGDES
ncbi:MAG: DUF4159 domain-containing protein [Phycisphaerae bacterium]